MIAALQDFAASFPEYISWLGVMLVSAIPFVESYFGSVIGVLIGLPTPVAIGVAVVGNVASMLAFVFSAHGVRTKVVAGRGGADAAPAGWILIGVSTLSALTFAGIGALVAFRGRTGRRALPAT